MSEYSEPVVLCTVPAPVAALLAGRLREAGIMCETAPSGTVYVADSATQVLVPKDRLDEARALAEGFGT